MFKTDGKPPGATEAIATVVVYILGAALFVGVFALFILADQRPTRTEADGRADMYRRLDQEVQCHLMERRRQLSFRECMKAEGY